MEVISINKKTKTNKLIDNTPTYEQGFEDGVSHLLRQIERMTELSKESPFLEILMSHQDPPRLGGI